VILIYPVGYTQSLPNVGDIERGSPMLPTKELSRGGALSALAINAEARGLATALARDVCMRCGEVRPVALSIPVRCIGERRIEQATFCKPCARRVKR
jgi:hypothetical protein